LQTVYCFGPTGGCRHGGRGDTVEIMVSCDVCQNWYHVDCLGMSAEWNKQIMREDAEYTCKACDALGGGDGLGF
jgi:hypothetical protein